MSESAIKIRDVSDKHELFRWVIEAMELTGCDVALPASLNQQCDEILSQLKSGEPVVLAPLDGNTIDRLCSLDYELVDTGFRKSYDVLNFLDIISSKVRSSTSPVRFDIEGALIDLFYCWEERNGFFFTIKWESDHVCEIYSTWDTLKEFGVFFQIIVWRREIF